MTSRDYTKEIALDSGDKIVPLRYAVPFLGAFALATLGTVRVLLAHTVLDHPAPIVEKTPAPKHAVVAQR